MADRLMYGSRWCCSRAGMVAVACFAVIPGAWSQIMTDPTRPALAQPGEQPEPAAGSPVLQSVLSSSLQQVAIISGRLVRLGDKVGSATVVRISESEVELKEGTQVQVLKMYPGIDKREAGRVAATSTLQAGRPMAGRDADRRARDDRR